MFCRFNTSLPELLFTTCNAVVGVVVPMPTFPLPLIRMRSLVAESVPPVKNINDLPVIVREKKLLTTGGWFILEHTPANNYEKEVLFKSSRNYGTTIFSIFVNS